MMLIIDNEHKTPIPWTSNSFGPEPSRASHHHSDHRRRLSPVNEKFLKSLGYNVFVKANGKARVRRVSEKAGNTQVLSANQVF